jgi:glycosyltransferase involved in cell wall biosynthesis
LISRAFATIFLPTEREGFYLPALEGMALGTLVICPDCVGNRGFCLHNENSLMPSYDLNSILSACLNALELLSKGTSLKITNAAYRKFQYHSLKRERDEFLRILNDIIDE